VSLYGQVSVGGFVMREEFTVSQSGTQLRLNGREASPPQTADHVLATHDNLTQMAGVVLPVTFTQKPSLNGFYRVADVSSELLVREGVEFAAWQATLERLGADRDVEFESSVPAIGRATDHVVAPVFWHAPPAGSGSYFTGATVPGGSVTRQSIDGPVIVHTALPVGVQPRWTSDAATYLGGSVRLDVAGIRRLGVFTPDAAVWEVHNGIIRLSSPGTDGAFQVSAWDGTQWRSEKSYRVAVAGTAVTGQPEVTVLRNNPEDVGVRLSYATSPGRLTVDLGLRRGSRFVTGVIKRHSAAALRIERTAAEAATVVTGGLKATTTDADGNRFVMGSAKTATTTTATASLEKAAVTVMDFFVGHEVGTINPVNEVQTVAFSGTVTGGTFTLTFAGQTTAGIAYNATAAAVQSALEALSTIGAGNVSVTGGPGPGTPYAVAFVGALAGTDVAQMTASGAALTGTTPGVAVTTTTQGVYPAAAGDLFADLLGQYLDAAGERVRLVRR
jgi:hypothetical protein